MLKKHARLLAPADDLPEGGTDVVEDEQEQTDEGEQAEGAQEEATEEGLTATIGEPEEEEEEHKAPGWIKELRKENREKAKKLKEVEAELQRLKGGQKNDELPPMPTLENPGTGREDDAYDQQVYAQQLAEWLKKKGAIEARQEQESKALEEQQKEWRGRQETYQEAKKRFDPEEIQEAEEEVKATLSLARQAMLLDVVDDPAALVLALSKNPEALQKLATIKSDGRAIKEMVLMEMNMKVTPKGKTPPPPERTISGSGKTAGSVRTALEKLHKEAQESGNYDAYYAEKRKQKG